jgi:hypothetical protein
MKEAQRLLGTIVDGADPVALKRRRRWAGTVGERLDRYVADMDRGAEPAPGFHHWTVLLQGVTPPVGGLGGVLEGVSEG